MSMRGSFRRAYRESGPLNVDGGRRRRCLFNGGSIAEDVVELVGADVAEAHEGHGEQPEGYILRETHWWELEREDSGDVSKQRSAGISVAGKFLAVSRV